MREPILPNIIEQRKVVLEEFFKFDLKLLRRIDYILKKISQVCGFTFGVWYALDNGDLDNFGNLSSLLYRNKVLVSKMVLTNCSSAGHSVTNTTILIKGKPMNLKKEFPKRWLFEKFEDELIEGKKLYFTFKERKDMAIRHAKELIKSKLSSQEIRILGL
jgi:hypothetical protein